MNHFWFLSVLALFWHVGRFCRNESQYGERRYRIKHVPCPFGLDEWWLQARGGGFIWWTKINAAAYSSHAEAETKLLKIRGMVKHEVKTSETTSIVYLRPAQDTADVKVQDLGDGYYGVYFDSAVASVLTLPHMRRIAEVLHETCKQVAPEQDPIRHITVDCKSVYPESFGGRIRVSMCDGGYDFYVDFGHQASNVITKQDLIILHEELGKLLASTAENS